MGGRLATASESKDVVQQPTAAYRQWIRSIAVSGGLIRPAPFFQSGSSVSSYCYSGSSYASTNYSSGSTFAAAGFRALCVHELRKVARRMVNDGYTLAMVQAFEDEPSKTTPYAGPDDALERWFLELDVGWVLEIRDEDGLLRLMEADEPATTLQDLVDKWIRALTVTVLSIKELHLAVDDPTPAHALFGRASVAKMLVFVDALVPALKRHDPAEQLQTLASMYGCVTDPSAHLRPDRLVSGQTQHIFHEMNSSLSRGETVLNEAIGTTMKEVRTRVEEDESWAIEIPRAGGDIHTNTRFLVDCILLMGRSCSTEALREYSYAGDNIRSQILKTVRYLEVLLRRKSELCSDPSLRYIFLLNNSYFATQQFQLLNRPLRIVKYWDFKSESCIDGYFHASWAQVVSCISEANPGLLNWKWKNNASSLAEFQSKFYKTYQAHKFWKVSSPVLRDKLRSIITERVILTYLKYLEENPELEMKYVTRGSNSPDDLEEMLGELFEG